MLYWCDAMKWREASGYRQGKDCLTDIAPLHCNMHEWWNDSTNLFLHLIDIDMSKQISIFQTQHERVKISKLLIWILWLEFELQSLYFRSVSF
jgi:hypothetical protein